MTTAEPMREIRLTLLNEPASREFVWALILRLARERPTHPIRHIAWLPDRIELYAAFPDSWTNEVTAGIDALIEDRLVLRDWPADYVGWSGAV